MSDEEEPLLLHSLVEVAGVIDAVLDVVRPATIVEIGSESGVVTERLVQWATPAGARVVSIDPDPPAPLHALVEGGAPLRLIAEPSPAALPGVDGELWVIDGDHNYATVTAELRHVFASEGPRMAILHDVEWPAGRRDQYYAPDRIAAGERHEHSYRGGVLPGVDGLVASGFTGRGAFAWATHEGGPANGVRTAIEDVAAEVGGLRLAVIPCLFGVGFLYTEAAPWAQAVGAVLAPFDGSDLLARLERNRVALFARILALQDTCDAQSAEHDRLVTALHLQIGTLEAEALAHRLAAEPTDE